MNRFPVQFYIPYGDPVVGSLDLDQVYVARLCIKYRDDVIVDDPDENVSYRPWWGLGFVRREKTIIRSDPISCIEVWPEHITLIATDVLKRKLGILD